MPKEIRLLPKKHWGNVRHLSPYHSGLSVMGSKSCLGGGYLGLEILALLPYPASDNYVEPFVGGGSIILNRKPVKRETINDYDERLINYFEVAVSKPEELQAMLDATLYSEVHFARALAALDDRTDAVRRAWAVAVVCHQRQPFAGATMTDSDWLYEKPHPKGDDPPRSLTWRSCLPDLSYVAERLKKVQILQRDAVEVLRKYETNPSADIYCDPPYYTAFTPYETPDLDVAAMTEALQAQKGRVAVSGINEEWDHLGWQKLALATRHVWGHKDRAKSKRLEYLWCNYEPSFTAQTALDLGDVE